MTGYALFDDLKTLFHKQTRLSDKPQWFILNRYLSMCQIPEVRDFSFKLDKYIMTKKGHKNSHIIETLVKVNIPTQRAPFIKYIRKPTEKAQEFDFIFKDLQNYFGWTNKELEAEKLILIELLKDKKELEKILKFIGADKKYFKKYKIEIKKPISVSNSLMKFMVKR